MYINAVLLTFLQFAVLLRKDEHNSATIKILSDIEIHP